MPSLIPNAADKSWPRGLFESLLVFDILSLSAKRAFYKVPQ